MNKLLGFLMTGCWHQWEIVKLFKCQYPGPWGRYTSYQLCKKCRATKLQIIRPVIRPTTT